MGYIITRRPIAGRRISGYVQGIYKIIGITGVGDLGVRVDDGKIVGRG